VDTIRCPSRQETEKAFRTDASFEDKARLADHALVCSDCRVKLNLMAGLKVEMKRYATDRRTGVQAGRAAPARQPSRRRFFDWAFAPATAVLMAGTMLLAALWINTPAGDGLSFRGTGPTVLDLIAPSGILSEPPRVFCWSPYPGVDSYGFELVDDKLEMLISYVTVNFATALFVPEDIGGRIRPGRTYVWRVWALDENSIPVATEQKSFEIRILD
jgi:hypothetical protein